MTPYESWFYVIGLALGFVAGFGTMGLLISLSKFLRGPR